MKKKLFWRSLNPKQRLKRYKNSLWLMVLAIIVLYVKLEFIIASGASLFIIILSFFEYKHLKAEADIFIKDLNKNT